MDDHHRSPQNPIPFHPDDAEHWRHPRPFRHTHPHQHPTTSRDAHAHTHGLDRDHHQINALEAEVQGLRVQLAPDQQAAHLEHTQLRAENARLYEALAFAASVIKSGESWTPTCEEMIGGALRGSSVTQPHS